MSIFCRTLKPPARRESEPRLIRWGPSADASKWSHGVAAGDRPPATRSPHAPLRRTLATLGALALTLVFVGTARADCGFDLYVKNASTDAFTVVKLSTASTSVRNVPIYKKQWEGSRVVAPGATEKFTFDVDHCPSSKSRMTKVFYQSRAAGTATYEGVEDHNSGATQTLN
jgi:hypothetical protein